MRGVVKACSQSFVSVPESRAADVINFHCQEDMHSEITLNAEVHAIWGHRWVRALNGPFPKRQLQNRCY